MNSRLTIHHSCLFLVLLVTCSFTTVRSQTTSKLKPLIEQIIASKVYLGYVKTGYDVVSGGLRVIRTIKEGDLQLHTEKFDALKWMNPKIKSLVQVAAIISMQVQINRAANFSNDELTADEKRYCTQVRGRLREDSEAVIDALVALTTSGELSMTDDGRLQRIDELYNQTQEQLVFITSFHQQTTSLILQRRAEKAQIEFQRKIHNQ